MEIRCVGRLQFFEAHCSVLLHFFIFHPALQFRRGFIFYILNLYLAPCSQLNAQKKLWKPSTKQTNQQLIGAQGEISVRFLQLCHLRGKNNKSKGWTFEWLYPHFNISRVRFALYGLHEAHNTICQ